MPSSSAVVLALAMLGLGAASAFAQSAGSRVVVYPTQGASSGSVRTLAPGGLPAPPPGPIESRIVALPDGTIPALPASASAAPPPAAAAPMGQPVYVAPPVTWGGGTSVAAAAPPSTPIAAPVAPAVPVPVVPGQGEPLAVIPFTFRSAILNDAAKAELNRVARTVKDKGLRQLEIRAFATGSDPDSRKVALARALVVRSYLIDQRLKARVEVGSFSGEGERVEILVPGS